VTLDRSTPGGNAERLPFHWIKRKAQNRLGKLFHVTRCYQPPCPVVLENFAKLL
jgi:hypothetical protein